MEMFDIDQMNLWGNDAIESILSQQTLMTKRPQNSELYNFSNELRASRYRVMTDLGESLRASETIKMNEVKRSKEKTGRYIVSEFKRIKNELDSSESGTFYLNETISTMVQSQFVDPACTPTHRLRPSEFEPRDEVFEVGSPMVSPDPQFQALGGSKARGDSMSQVFY